MFRRKGVYSLLLLISTALAAGGCGGRLVQRPDLLEATNRIAVISTVMPRVADTSREANRKVLQAAVDHAAVQARAGLAGIRPWKVLDSASIDRGKASLLFGQVSLQDLAARFPEVKERNRVRDSVASHRELWRERFISPPGLPVVPREAFATDEGESEKDPEIHSVMLEQAGRM